MWRLGTCAVLAALAAWGCSFYEPNPLDRAAVEEGLKVPPPEVLRADARAIRHPILGPIEYDDRDGLSPDEAAVLAVLLNPTLRAARDKRGVAEAEIIEAGILPNPEIHYMLTDLLSNLPKAVDGVTWQNEWWSIINPLLGRWPKISAAEAHAAAVDLDVAWQEWQVAQTARLHAFRLVHGERVLALARESEADLMENAALVALAVARGEKKADQLSAARVAAQEARGAVLELERAQERERLALNRALGVPAGTPVPLQKDIQLPAWPSSPAGSDLLMDLEDRRLDLMALRRGYESQDETYYAAILQQFPSFLVRYGRSRSTSGVRSQAIGIGISAPIFDRNQGQVAITKATRQQLFDEYIARVFDARSEVAKILAEMEALRGQIRAAEDSLPAVEDLVQNTGAALQEGRADIPSYYEARSRLSSMRRQVLERRRELVELGVALEIESGRYFPSVAR